MSVGLPAMDEPGLDVMPGQLVVAAVTRAGQLITLGPARVIHST